MEQGQQQASGRLVPKDTEYRQQPAALLFRGTYVGLPSFPTGRIHLSQLCGSCSHSCCKHQKLQPLKEREDEEEERLLALEEKRRQQAAAKESCSSSSSASAAVEYTEFMSVRILLLGDSGTSREC